VTRKRRSRSSRASYVCSSAYHHLASASRPHESCARLRFPSAGLERGVAEVEVKEEGRVGGEREEGNPEKEKDRRRIRRSACDTQARAQLAG